VNYISTRGEGSPVSFEEAMLRGLAPDGGLYMPDHWPQLPEGWQEAMKDATYADFAYFVAEAFAGESFEADELRTIVTRAYAGFDDPVVAPLRELEDGLYLLELFHGPTFAFKDFAMQMLGHLFEAALTRRGERRTIVVATSGDTGAAAVEAFAGRIGVDLFVMHPEGRISDAQRRQMTSCTAANVHNIAVEGSFDDCQRVLKSLFADDAFREEVHLGAVNSINWARIMAQTAYYLSTLARLERHAAFSVPTGNFGDIFAGYVAKRMGAQLGPLVIATNTNDILHRTLKTGTYKVEGASPTLSPAMDIQVASNFERLLFDLMDGDASTLKDQMAQLVATGEFALRPDAHERMRQMFRSSRVSDEEILAEIARAHETYGVLIDPHTAVGLRAEREALSGVPAPHVVLSTAHPAKFAETVERATGQTPQIPAKLARLMAAEERFDRLPPDEGEIMAYVRARI